MAPLLLVMLFLATARCTEGQPLPPSNDDETPYAANFSPALAIVIVVVVGAFFFLAFFSVYIRRCSGDRSAISPAVIAAAAASRRGIQKGLDPAVIDTFPTLVYSAVRALKIGKEVLECAVCLCEFSEDETLRMLPKCCHVFHPDCIDVWLASHVTCPVCRSNLSIVAADSESAREEVNVSDTDLAIDVEGGDRSEEAIYLARMRSRSAVGPARLPKSRSTGYGGDGVDRFTLRLPEHVRKDIVAEGMLRRSASIAAFPAGGEGSSRRGFRNVRLGRSDRWSEFFVRTFSARRRGEGEGSVKKVEMAAEGSAKGGIFPSVKPTLNCLGGGGGAKSDSGDDDEESSTAPLSRV